MLGSLDFDSTNTYLAASIHHMNNYSGPSVGIFNVEIRDGFGVSGLAWSLDGYHISAIVGGNS
jgi:hypothetical protein